MKMKRNTLNKITDWVEKVEVWISNKKPSNKYLRIVYYFLTGLICSMVAIPLFILLLVVIASVIWLFNYLINFSSVRVIMTLLLYLLFFIVASLLGYLMFGDF